MSEATRAPDRILAHAAGFGRTWRTDSTSAIGSRSESLATMAMANANALKAKEATNNNPKIVEDQAGEIDITQSMAAKVTVRIKSTMPGPLSTRIFFVAAPSVLVSCSRDHLFKRKASKSQMAK